MAIDCLAISFKKVKAKSTGERPFQTDFPYPSLLSDYKERLLGSRLDSRLNSGHWPSWELFLGFILTLISRTWLCCSKAQALGLFVQGDR